MAEEQGVQFDEFDLPEYGEDEAISDAFAEKPTPLTAFSPQGEEQARTMCWPCSSNLQSFAGADDFSGVNEADLADSQKRTNQQAHL